MSQLTISRFESTCWCAVHYMDKMGADAGSLDHMRAMDYHVVEGRDSWVFLHGHVFKDRGDAVFSINPPPSRFWLAVSSDGTTVSFSSPREEYVERNHAMDGFDVKFHKAIVCEGNRTAATLTFPCMISSVPALATVGKPLASERGNIHTGSVGAYRIQQPAPTPRPNATPMPSEPASNSGSIKCGTYNVCFGCMNVQLRGKDATSSTYTTTHCKDGTVCLESVRQLIRRSTYDVLALQEAEAHEALLESKRATHHTETYTDAQNVACMSISTAFTIVDRAGISLSTKYGDGRPAQAVLCKKGGVYYAFINVHCPHGGEFPAKKIQSMLSKLVKGIPQDHVYHVILMGDFNENGQRRLWNTGVELAGKQLRWNAGYGAATTPPNTCCKRGDESLQKPNDYVLSDLRLVKVTTLDKPSSSDHAGLICELTSAKESHNGLVWLAEDLLETFTYYNADHRIEERCLPAAKIYENRKKDELPLTFPLDATIPDSPELGVLATQFLCQEMKRRRDMGLVATYEAVTRSLQYNAKGFRVGTLALAIPKATPSRLPELQNFDEIMDWEQPETLQCERQAITDKSVMATLRLYGLGTGHSEVNTLLMQMHTFDRYGLTSNARRVRDTLKARLYQKERLLDAYNRIEPSQSTTVHSLLVSMERAFAYFQTNNPAANIKVYRAVRRFPLDFRESPVTKALPYDLVNHCLCSATTSKRVAYKYLAKGAVLFELTIPAAFRRYIPLYQLAQQTTGIERLDSMYGRFNRYHELLLGPGTVFHIGEVSYRKTKFTLSGKTVRMCYPVLSGTVGFNNGTYRGGGDSYGVYFGGFDDDDVVSSGLTAAFRDAMLAGLAHKYHNEAEAPESGWLESSLSYIGALDRYDRALGDHGGSDGPDRQTPGAVAPSHASALRPVTAFGGGVSYGLSVLAALVLAVAASLLA